MKRFHLMLATILCLLLVAPIASAAGKETWMSVRSKNFFLIGNASEKEIRQVATRLEQFRDVFTRLFPKANFQSPVPTTVIVFKSDGAYKPFKPLYQGKPASVAGYFQPGPDVNYITLTTEKSAENPYRIIFHEYVHLLVNNNMQTPPAWFNEGLAEYYSTFEITDDRKAYLGNLISHHLQLLREKFIPLRTLFAVDRDSPLYNERDKQSIFYAESWALVHYLILGNNGQRLSQLGEFLNRLTAGAALEGAFQQAFQTSLETLEKELKEYVKQRDYRGQVATFEKKLEFDAEMQSAPLTEAEAQAYLGDLLLHTNRLDDAAARLEQAMTLDPQLATAHASLGMTRMRQKRFAEAKQHLQRAVAANSQNYLAHFYYAYALSREGMNEGQFVSGYPSETANTMRAELRKAIELKPDFPESYRLLAFINLVTGEQLDESIALLKRALALSPGSEEYAFVLGQLYTRKEEFAAARQTLEPIARNGADPQLRANAQSLLNSISSMQEQIARFKSRSEPAGAASAAAEEDKEPPPQTPRLKPRTDSTNNPQPNETLSADANFDPNSALEEALRKPRDGETRVRGLLIRIDCNANGIWYTVKVGDRILKLHSNSFDTVDLSAYTTEVKGEISCGPRNPANDVVITFRPAKDARAKIDGEVTAVEFVPKEFQLKQR